jgi:ParB/RepB/Spo0J family partition protein
MSGTAPEIRSIPLTSLVFSQTRAQIERRAHFDRIALTELSETIKAAGRPEQLITVRPVLEGKFEVADGERRCIASEMAGLSEILCDIRDLTDDQVLDIQIVTGLQKEGLHELVEAEGYEVLTKRGLSAEEIAAKVGKSKAYIYARLKLLALDPASRQALYRGELNASTALLAARIPVASLQRKFCGEITQTRWGEPMSYREALEHYQENYTLRLEDAPFPTDRVDLGRNVGACSSCPKRTGNQPELFGDIKGADVCTDPTCFKAKREAWGKLRLEQAKTSGQKVITGSAAKKIAPYGEHTLAAGYAKLNDKCWDDPKGRTYKQILGKDAKPDLLQMPKSGDVIEVVPKSLATKALKDAGIIKPEKRQSPYGTAKSKDTVNDDALLQCRLFAAIHKAAPNRLPRLSLETLIEHEMDVVGTLPDLLAETWGCVEEGIPDLEKLSEPQLQQFLWELLVVDDLSGSGEHTTDKLLSLAKSLKIDAAAIRKQVAAEQKAAAAEKPAPAKAAKKKGAKK